jgi:hypothetical protein
VTKKGRSLSKVVWPSSSRAPLPRQVAKVGRNNPCPCGSGRKYKDCHEKEGEAFLAKLARRQEKERRKEAMKRLKEEGVPWWRRWLGRA